MVSLLKMYGVTGHGFIAENVWSEGAWFHC